LLPLWWCLLHGLLVAAVALVAWPLLTKGLALAAVLAHLRLRRPAAAPGLVLVDGNACAVPEWRTGLRPLGARTLVAPLWVRLDLGRGPWRRELLLLVDQLEPQDWRRLRAALARARAAE
jgi:hypothetical protein